MLKRRGGRLARDRGGAAAIELALVAPVAVTMALGAYDIASAYIVWEQACDAAAAVAEAAAKLSVTAGSTTTQLTYTQMQAAMSMVYARIPTLSLGDGTSSSTSTFSVTLSGIVYAPTCATTSGCAAQTPYTAWSSYLSQTGVAFATAPLRACGKLTAVASFPGDGTQLTRMVSWSVAAGGGQIALAPQVVADVRATYVPVFSLFLGTVTVWCSAAMPAPLGTTSQAITFNATAPTGNVQSCTVP
jgi:Flp pilus assembly protein TadG